MRVCGVSAECTFVVAGAGSAVERLASPSLSVCIEPAVASAFAPVQSAATNVVAWFPLATVWLSSSTPGTGAMSPSCSRRFVWLGLGELGLPGLSLLVCLIAGVRGLVAAKGGGWQGELTTPERSIRMRFTWILRSDSRIRAFSRACG